MRSSSLNTLAPRMRIWRILAASPSTTVKRRPTRLRSKGVTVVVTVAAYLPRALYWRLSSCSALSSSALSKVRATPSPRSDRLDFS